MKALLLSVFTVLASYSVASAEIVRFKASDGVSVTADFQKPNDTFSTIIVLFHMAGASRGEYVKIAKKLNSLGYATLAVDQRSGRSFNGVQNETVKAAGGSTDFLKTIPDFLAASDWAHKNSGARRVGVLGSSYAAGLVLVLSGKGPGFADAVMAFSPGEYFGTGNYVLKDVGNIKVPVFLTSAKNETRQWRPFKDRIGSNVEGFVPTGAGRHGASVLDTAGGKEYWSALEGFLQNNLPPS